MSVRKIHPINVPIDAEDFSINNVGCLRYTIKHGSLAQSSVIDPETIGEYLDPFMHELVGYSMIGGKKYVFYKFIKIGV